VSSPTRCVPQQRQWPGSPIHDRLLRESRQPGPAALSRSHQRSRALGVVRAGRHATSGTFAFSASACRMGAVLKAAATSFQGFCSADFRIGKLAPKAILMKARSAGVISAASSGGISDIRVMHDVSRIPPLKAKPIPGCERLRPVTMGNVLYSGCNRVDARLKMRNSAANEQCRFAPPLDRPRAHVL
jgi:hypothetical protein